MTDFNKIRYRPRNRTFDTAERSAATDIQANRDRSEFKLETILESIVQSCY